MINTTTRKLLSRRTFLRAGAVCIGLPFLNAMLPRRTFAADVSKPRRLVLVARNLGLHAPFLFPEKTGLEYESTRYLKLMDEHRGLFTLFSGISHLGYASHHCEKGLFTGVDWERIKNPNAVRNSISLDQFVAPYLGTNSRYSNLVLGASEGQLSWTANGVPVPPDREPSDTFKQLFIDGAPDQVAREVRRLSHGKSILDDIGDQAKSLSKSLGQEDRDRIELMFGSIRDAEQSLQRTQAWAAKPKPRIDYQLPKVPPTQNEVNAHESLWYDVVRLALQTDSTRVVQLTLSEVGRAKLDGFTGSSHHDVSHHGKDPSKIEQLALVEEAELKQFNRFLSLMKQTREGDSTLLDNTVILSASNLGNASAHSGDNLPILLAGGGFKHQGHVGFDRKNNQPLSNLYVRVLQQLGIAAERFGASRGVVSEV